MSTILINTLTGTSTAGSIAVTGEGGSTTTNLQQGLAKAFSNFDGTISTLSADDSFNLSSLTDNGVGDHTVNATNSFNNRHYSVSGSAAYEDGASGYANAMRVLSINSFTSPSTSALRINTCYSNANTEDCKIVTPVIHGDLA